MLKWVVVGGDAGGGLMWPCQPKLPLIHEKSVTNHLTTCLAHPILVWASGRGAICKPGFKLLPFLVLMLLFFVIALAIWLLTCLRVSSPPPTPPSGP